MNPEHKRIVELANGWEGSDAVVSLSPADALLLSSVGAKVTPGKRPADPSTIAGKDLYAAGETVRTRHVETPDGAQPTPNQQSVPGPGTDPDPNGTNEGGATAATTGTKTVAGADLDALTVAELKDVAAAEKIELHGARKQAEIVEAVKKARAAK